jgi:hypothetical protein
MSFYSGSLYAKCFDCGVSPRTHLCSWVSPAGVREWHAQDSQQVCVIKTFDSHISTQKCQVLLLFTHDILRVWFPRVPFLTASTYIHEGVFQPRETMRSGTDDVDHPTVQDTSWLQARAIRSESHWLDGWILLRDQATIMMQPWSPVAEESSNSCHSPCFLGLRWWARGSSKWSITITCCYISGCYLIQTFCLSVGL